MLPSCSSIDKGLYSIADGLSDIDRISGKRVSNFTPREKQISQSNEIMDQIIQEAYVSKGLKINNELDSAAYKRVERIFNKVHSVSHMGDEDWDIYLVPDDSFNAYVTGGTVVAVNLGLIQQAKNDDEIAAVIGHEIAHVAANHLYEKRAHSLAAQLKGSKSINRGTFNAAFTHEGEEEADMVGTLYAALAGYDPFAASELWQRMYDAKGNFSARIVDHPIYSERVENTRKYAEAYKKYYKHRSVNTDHATILYTNEVFGHGLEDMSSTANTPGQGGGFLAALEVFAEGMSTHYSAKAEEARQGVRVLKIERVTRSLEILEQKKIRPHTIAVTANYKGFDTLNNLTLMGAIGNETATQKLQYPVNSNSKIEFNLEFSKEVPDNVESQLSVIVTHVD